MRLLNMIAAPDITNRTVLFMCYYDESYYKMRCSNKFAVKDRGEAS